MAGGKTRHKIILILITVVLCAGVSTGAASTNGSTELVTRALDGGYADNVSGSFSLSHDGRFVAFFSLAGNLVTGDTNTAWDAFVRDTESGVTERVSVPSSGIQSNEPPSSSDFYDWANRPLSAPTISADGRYVAFESLATNLVPGDTNGQRDVFVKDRITGTVARASVSSAGTQGNQRSHAPSLSANGRFVAFVSLASNLAPGDTNKAADIFVKDRQTGALTLVSSRSDGSRVSGSSGRPVLSQDGNYVTFGSSAMDLVPGPYPVNVGYGVFVKDIQTGVVMQASTKSDGSKARSYSDNPMISHDGRFVGFSIADEFFAGPDIHSSQSYIKDTVTGNTIMISTAPDGTPGNRDSGGAAAFTGDGRYVMFSSAASNLVPGDTNGKHDVFLRDIKTGATSRISKTESGGQRNDDTFGGAISCDGRSFAFRATTVTNNGSQSDIYLARLDNNSQRSGILFSRCAPSAGSALRGAVTIPAATEDNARVFSVALLDGNKILSTKRGDSFVFSLDTRKLTNGSHSIRLKAKRRGKSSAVRRAYRIDNTRPVIQAPYGVAIKRPANAKLYYKVSDGYSSKAYIKIVIKNSSGTVVGNIRAGWKQVNRLHYQTYRFREVGTFRFYVYAVDEAGNTQASIASNKVVVK